MIKHLSMSVCMCLGHPFLGMPMQNKIVRAQTVPLCIHCIYMYIGITLQASLATDQIISIQVHG